MRGGSGMHCSTPDVLGVPKVPLGAEFSTPLYSGRQAGVLATLFMKNATSVPLLPHIGEIQPDIEQAIGECALAGIEGAQIGQIAALPIIMRREQHIAQRQAAHPDRRN